MFFDRTTRRIYYTLSGSQALYYRYFQPDSQVVGAWRYRAADRNVKWAAVRGTFVVGARLYYLRQPAGQLYSIAWRKAGLTVGKAQPVGPSGQRAAATVLAPTG